MDKRIEVYLNEKRKEYNKKQKKKYKKNKADTLLELGLWEKEYSPDGMFSNEYCFRESKEGEELYFKRVPINISDEDFDMLTEELAQMDVEEDSDSNNEKEEKSIVKFLWVIAWLLFGGGFLCSFIVVGRYGGTGFFVCLGSFMATGALYAGIAEIIELLNDIKYSVEKNRLYRV